MSLPEHIQLVLLELKRQKKAERFPDHICAQANNIIVEASQVSYWAKMNKFNHEIDMQKTDTKNQIKQSLISTMASCLRMLEEIEKEK